MSLREVMSFSVEGNTGDDGHPHGGEFTYGVPLALRSSDAGDLRGIDLAAPQPAVSASILCGNDHIHAPLQKLPAHRLEDVVGETENGFSNSDYVALKELGCEPLCSAPGAPEVRVVSVARQGVDGFVGAHESCPDPLSHLPGPEQIHQAQVYLGDRLGIMAREALADRRARAAAVLELLRGVYPDATTELKYRNVFELLIVTILSAQATDKSVNQVSPTLFQIYPDAPSLAATDPKVVMSLIRHIGLYRTKAHNIVLAARKLMADHGGVVPNDFGALLALPGVGRKTANVVLATAFGRPAIAVDTHVGRLARRLGFSSEDHPDRVEDDLESLFPEDSWILVHHALILHGRRVCQARSPNCGSCSLRVHCPSRLV